MMSTHVYKQNINSKGGGGKANKVEARKFVNWKFNLFKQSLCFQLNRIYLFNLINQLRISMYIIFYTWINWNSHHNTWNCERGNTRAVGRFKFQKELSNLKDTNRTQIRSQLNFECLLNTAGNNWLSLSKNKSIADGFARMNDGIRVKLSHLVTLDRILF